MLHHHKPRNSWHGGLCSDSLLVSHCTAGSALAAAEDSLALPPWTSLRVPVARKGISFLLSALASVHGICVLVMPGQQCFQCFLIPSVNTSEYQSPSRVKFNSKTSSDFKAAEAQLYSSVWKEENYSQIRDQVTKKGTMRLLTFEKQNTLPFPWRTSF